MWEKYLEKELKNFGWNLGGETHMGWKAFWGGILTYNHVHNILRLFDS